MSLTRVSILTSAFISCIIPDILSVAREEQERLAPHTQQEPEHKVMVKQEVHDVSGMQERKRKAGDGEPCSLNGAYS